MTKRRRRVLFLFFVGVFLILSPIITLYAIGYKYDFINNRFVMTGSMHIKAQTGATVFLEDRIIKNTSFFNNSFSRNRLLPGEHKIRLEKEGYHSWQKSILIKEGLLSDFSSVFLIKEDSLIDTDVNLEIASKIFTRESFDISKEETDLILDFFSVSIEKLKKIEKLDGYFYVLGVFNNKSLLYKIDDKFIEEELELIDSGVRNFMFSYDNEKLAWFTKNETWIQWLHDTSYQPFKKRGTKELITRTSNIIRSIQWFTTNSHLFVLNGEKIEFIELDERGNRNIYKIYEAKNIEDIIFYEKDSRLYIYLEKEIISVEL